MLPDFDGLDLCPVLRQSGKVPIIILSARGQKADKVKGLKLGADDYITKPFDLQELLARISAVLRRAHPALERLLIGKLVIDFRSQRASCDAGAGPPDAPGIRTAALSRRAAGEGRAPRRAVTGSVGIHRHERHDPLGGSRHRAAAKKNRARPAPSGVHPDGAWRWVLSECDADEGA